MNNDIVWTRWIHLTWLAVVIHMCAAILTFWLHAHAIPSGTALRCFGPVKDSTENNLTRIAQHVCVDVAQDQPAWWGHSYLKAMVLTFWLLVRPLFCTYFCSVRGRSCSFQEKDRANEQRHGARTTRLRKAQWARTQSTYAALDKQLPKKKINAQLRTLFISVDFYFWPKPIFTSKTIWPP